MKIVPGTIFLFYLILTNVFAQVPFSIQIKQSLSITNAPALHSGVFISYNNKWIFIGGRKNGLHGFQPPFAFPASSVNDKIYVVDPLTDQSWSVSTSTLPKNISEPINSSNMQFYLSDTTLYMIGGYGWKDSIADFITFPTLTAVNIKGLMNAVIQGNPIGGYFRQVKDERLAICGTHVQKIDSTYYLVFGHRFDGRYDRSSTTGFHVQRYSNEIRKFNIADNGTNLSITNYSADHDSVNFHRRDLNIIPQRYFSGEKGLTAFSGVFQYDVNLPYLTCINISKNGNTVDQSFNQNLSQYHSAYTAIYDSVPGKQYNIFFGGISLYYIDTLSNAQVKDTTVPFVNTVSIVVRDKNNTYTEYNSNTTMPALLGTNAYFFPAPGIQMISNEIIDYTNLSGNRLIGYITGGIDTPDPNISLSDPSLSSANSLVYEVWLNKASTGVRTVNVTDNSILDLAAFPSPVTDNVTLQFISGKQQSVKIDLFSMQGQLVQPVFAGPVNKEKVHFTIDTKGLSPGNYFFIVRNSSFRRTVKVTKK
ncbi:MAG: T9SS type A sorting domain-containing protein [Bacteroidetes bacterium]|nr:T9SS type A sorting domain-containing protein [Bacteroidota bacterium]